MLIWMLNFTYHTIIPQLLLHSYSVCCEGYFIFLGLVELVSSNQPESHWRGTNWLLLTASAIHKFYGILDFSITDQVEKNMSTILTALLLFKRLLNITTNLLMTSMFKKILSFEISEFSPQNDSKNSKKSISCLHIQPKRYFDGKIWSK